MHADVDWSSPPAGPFVSAVSCQLEPVVWRHTRLHFEMTLFIVTLSLLWASVLAGNKRDLPY